MKERPIIFDAESIKRILDWRKTQTRRVINPQPEETYPGADIWLLSGSAVTNEYVNPVIGSDTLIDHYWHNVESPYGGGEYADGTFDRLWVREAWGSSHTQYLPGLHCWYYADGEPPFATGPAWRKRSPIHMPRWASRITLQVMNVRVERLQSISDADAKAEGVKLFERTTTHYAGMWRDAFAERWDALNAKRGYTWKMNPWVWAITFQVMQQEEKQ